MITFFGKSLSAGLPIYEGKLVLPPASTVCQGVYVYWLTCNPQHTRVGWCYLISKVRKLRVSWVLQPRPHSEESIGAAYDRSQNSFIPTTTAVFLSTYYL